MRMSELGFPNDEGDQQKESQNYHGDELGALKMYLVVRRRLLHRSLLSGVISSQAAGYSLETSTS